MEKDISDDSHEEDDLSCNDLSQYLRVEMEAESDGQQDEDNPIIPLNSKINPFDCPLCSLTPKNKTELASHLWEGHIQNNQTDCPLCQEKYFDPSDLTLHFLLTHAAAAIGSFECPKCPKKYQRGCHLANHLKIHNQTPKVITCPICSQTLKTQFNLKIHMRRHNNDLRYICPVPDCSKAFVGSTELTYHQKTVHSSPNEAFTCSVCQKGFKVKSVWRRHLKTHQTKSFKCLQCTKLFTDQLDLDKHVKTCKGKRTFVCSICGIIRYSNLALQTHLKMHTGQVMICPRQDCGKEYYNKYRLEKHIRLHDKGKEFKCEDPSCGKLFSEKGNLTAHVRAIHPHLVSNPDGGQLCPICGVNVYGSRKKHMEKHSEDRPFKCHVCPQAFKRKAQLDHHINRHENNRTFFCTYEGCSKSFYRPFELKNHLKTHTGEKDYLCTVCGRASTSAGNLKKHMMVHSDEKQFKCTFCDMAFKQPQLLKTHVKSHTH